MTIDRPYVSPQIGVLYDAIGTFVSWASRPDVRAATGPGVSNFMFGNPHDLAPQTYVDALIAGSTPGSADHFAYKMNEENAVGVVAASLSDRFGMAFEPEDVLMTNGNFSGLSICLHAAAAPGDEVVYVSPPWFFYETLILESGATPVSVRADQTTWDLDLEAIAAAIGPKTAAIIVNSPNNPTGRIYPRSTLNALAAILTEASERNGRPIYLLSDEAYNRIVYDGREYPTPVAHYPWSFYIYTYGKTHLAPGLRLGYVALTPSMPGREALRDPLLLAQVARGWAFPVAPLQHAIADLDAIGIDVSRLQARRDLLVSALREQGYDDVVEPEGTFYVIARSPIPDDQAFFDILAAHDVYVLPGSVFEMPGWFRLSLTANDEMCERAVPTFAKAIQEAGS
jgi:aspartate aminotransferase